MPYLLVDVPGGCTGWVSIPCALPCHCSGYVPCDVVLSTKKKQLVRTRRRQSTWQSQRALQPRTPTALGKIQCYTFHKSTHPLLRSFTFPAWQQYHCSIVVLSLHSGHLVLEGKDNEVPTLHGIAPPGLFPSAVSDHSSPHC